MSSRQLRTFFIATSVAKYTKVVLMLIVLVQLLFIPVRKVHAATSPTLGTDLSGFSVLGGQAVTNTNATTTTGGVGVSPLTSITGFPPGIAGGDNSVNLHSNDTHAISAQADNLIAFGILDQTCDFTLGAGFVDLGGMTLVPGVYCAGSFGLTGTLTLSGSVDEVYIFKAESTLITGSGSLVVGGDPCNIWWRIGSSTTLGTGTSFVGTVISQNGVNAMNSGATLNGRFLALSAGTVTLDSNTITGPTCMVSPTPTAPPGEPTPTPTATPLPTPTQTPSGSGDTDSTTNIVSNTTTGDQVFGETTQMLAATGSKSQLIRYIVASTAALFVFLFGKVLLRGNETT